MREESHLDEMRSAIRGDFERLAKRRGEQELMRVGEERCADGTVEAISSQVASEMSRVEPEPEVEPEAEQMQTRRSWIARMLSPP